MTIRPRPFPPELIIVITGKWMILSKKAKHMIISYLVDYQQTTRPEDVKSPGNCHLALERAEKWSYIVGGLLIKG